MPNNKGRKRRFGSIRQVKKDAYQANYLGPDGRRHFAPHMFKRYRDADRWLNKVEDQISAGKWSDPDRAKITLADYAGKWIDQRPGLRPRTVSLYRWLNSTYIEPHLGNVELGRLSTAAIRQWRSDRLSEGASETVLAKAYRLLRSILNTAVDEDQILSQNPCRIRGADQENPAERPVLSVSQVFELADSIEPDRFRVLILLTAFASLRFGEVTALRRGDLAPDASSVRVSRTFVEVTGKGLIEGPPKSRAGRRTVSIPKAVRPDILEHLDTYVKAEPDALLFTGLKGNALRRPNFSQRSNWTSVVAKLGLKGLHFHDLRHAGNLWASKAGMSTKDLMARMGHDDMRAALIYQRATSDADERIADRLSELAEEHRPSDEPGDGEPPEAPAS